MGKARILIVEDEAIIAQDLKWQLEAGGYEVPCVLNKGDDALIQAEKNNIDLVLMDIMLPGKIDGVEAAGNIHSILDIPVIYLTAYADDEILDRAKKTSPYGYLIKPVDRHELSIIIELALHKHKSEKEILRAKKEWEQTFDSIPDLIAIIGLDHKIIRANNSMARKLGVKREDLIGKLCYNVVHGTDEPPRHCPHSKTLLDGKEHIEEFSAENMGGHYLLSATPLFDSEGKISGVIEIARDITERKELEDQLRTSAITDELTGLYNRRGFFALSQQQGKLAQRSKKIMSLLYIDLDNLKIINDTLGHQAGDRALSITAGILKKSCRESDIIARMGGDEFAVLLLDLTESYSAKQITNNLRDNINAFNKQSGNVFKLSFSVGISDYDPKNPCSMDELVSRADKSMYENKRKSKSIPDAS